MASPGSLVSDTTLSLIVKQLQFFSQEIGALKQQRATAAQHVAAVEEKQLLQIDALEAQLSRQINNNEKRLNSIEASLAKLVNAAAEEGPQITLSSSTLILSTSSTAIAPSSERDLAVASAATSKRARCSGTETASSNKRKRSNHVDTSSSSGGALSEHVSSSPPAASASRARSKTARRDFSQESDSSVIVLDADHDSDCGDGDDDGNGSFIVGGGSYAFAKAATAAPSSAAITGAPASASGGGTVAQAASAAWTAAIAAARARVTLHATYFRKGRAAEAQSALSSIVKRAAASTSLSLAAAESRLAEATSAVTSASHSLNQLQRNKVDEMDPRYSLFVTWANAADAAENAALRWAAAADVALDPAPTQVDAAAGGTASLISQLATTALTAAVAAARVRVDLVRHVYADRREPKYIRDAKRALFTAEYRLALANASAAAANSRLTKAKAAHRSAYTSNGQVNSVLKKCDVIALTLSTTWLKATEEAVAAAEAWVAAAEAAEAQVLPRPRPSKKKR